jgi:hypothetical protein
MQTTPKGSDSRTFINDFLESVSKLSLDDQLMISQIIHNRVIEAKRKEFANSVKESKEEYFAGKTGRGSTEDFLKETENE